MQEIGGELDAMRDHDYADDSELSPRVVHNHYSQQKNGNGGSALNGLLAFCGALLLILVTITGFMWRSQLDFQTAVTDRLARLETKIGLQPTP